MMWRPGDTRRRDVPRFAPIVARPVGETERADDAAPDDPLVVLTLTERYCLLADRRTLDAPHTEFLTLRERDYCEFTRWRLGRR